MLPSSPATRNIIGSTELAAMKRTAIFVNAGRGDTVDTDALVAALQGSFSGADTGIAAAVLDVVRGFAGGPP